MTAAGLHMLVRTTPAAASSGLVELQAEVAAQDLLLDIDCVHIRVGSNTAPVDHTGLGSFHSAPALGCLPPTDSGYSADSMT